MPLPANISEHQPKITGCKKGQICIDGRSYKDAKIWPEGAREWTWGETGTEHEPGVQISDIDDMLAHDEKVGLDALILSEGMDSKLHVPQETIDFAKRERRVSEVHVLPTPKAVELYNDMVSKGRRVAGLFHTTC